ncbi:hypothetical protein ANCCAN_11753 [Ancylostoma caninum]|uniref:Uncharacterized protein n=1 Tax=Ancylostoma caninum TaxID=29170 RepID=A0A368GF20_ANCCA|nr:hypothetical protein ANCCAN_11753 [Ancylostoma caninum]
MANGTEKPIPLLVFDERETSWSRLELLLQILWIARSTVCYPIIFHIPILSYQLVCMLPVSKKIEASSMKKCESKCTIIS